jgi:UDP-glucose 4-epimerase
MKDSDIVFHLAANPDVRIGSKNPELEIKQGYLSTFNVLEAMRLNDIKFIVYSSSSVVYGETNTKSISEDYSPLLPISLYGATKLGSEALINSYSGTFNFQSWIFRFANIVGSRGTHGIIVDLINKLKKDTSQLEILGNGKQCKPYLHVSDCVEGMICGQSFTCDGQNIFNLGCDSTTTVTKIAEILLEEMNLKDTKLIYTGGDRGWVGDIPRFKLNSKKMHKLGWKPKYTSDEAIRISIREILDNVKNVK